jgi:hypothetical protein
MRVLCTCGKVLLVDAALKGKTVRCPHCNGKVKIDTDTEEFDALDEAGLTVLEPRENGLTG